MSRWKPIGTYRPGVDPDVFFAVNKRGGRQVGINNRRDEYTHWQPLPPMPGQDGEVLEWAEDGAYQWAGDAWINYTAGPKYLSVFNAAMANPLEILVPNQPAAMELAQGISDLIRKAQGEPGGGTA